MINNDRLVQILENQNPVINFFKRLHARFGVGVYFERLENNSIRQVTVMENPPSVNYFSEGSSLLSPMEVTTLTKNIDLQELLIYFRLPYELVKDKEDITSFVAERIQFQLNDAIKTQQYGERPVQWTSNSDSKIYITKFRVMSGSREDCCSYEIAAKCNVGILLSTELHSRIVNTMCRSCAKRLRCALIPDQNCKLSYLMENYVKFKDR